MAFLYFLLSALLAFFGVGMQLDIARATNIHVVNKCGTKVCVKYWVASNGVGGGCKELGAGEAWDVAASSSWQGATMWAIPGSCATQQPCNTGPPSGVTQFEFSIAAFSNSDYYDVSMKAGFNLGISVSPTNAGCRSQSCLSPDSCQGFIDANTPDRTLSCRFGSTDYVVSFA